MTDEIQPYEVPKEIIDSANIEDKPADPMEISNDYNNQALAIQHAINNQTGVQTVVNKGISTVKPLEKRNLEAINKSFLSKASIAGENFYYDYDRKYTNARGERITTHIFGASVGMALEYLNHWENFDFDVPLPLQFVDNGTPYWVIRPVYIDYEKCVRITTSYISPRVAKGQQFSTALHIAISKAERNFVLKFIMPVDIRLKALEIAKKSVIDQTKNLSKKDLKAKINNCINGFKEHGVTQETLEEFVDTKSDEWTAKHLQTFIGYFNALQEGYEKPENMFVPK